MHALRLHKDTLLGGHKATEKRRLQQETRQRDARGSVLQGLRSFFTADSFMYGPLVQGSPPRVTVLSDSSEPHTPEREQETGGLDDSSTRDDEDGEENENTVVPYADNNNGHDESAVRRYDNPGSRSNVSAPVSAQRTSARMTTRTVLQQVAEGSRTPSSTARVPKPSRNGTQQIVTFNITARIEGANKNVQCSEFTNWVMQHVHPSDIYL